MSCQQICHTLNDSLQTLSFSEAAGLTPEHFSLKTDVDAQLVVALGVLHEAMLEAIFEFETMCAEELQYKLSVAVQDTYAELAVARS